MLDGPVRRLFPLGLGAEDRLLEESAVELHSRRRVVVAGHGVGEETRIAAGVDDADRRDVHLGALGDGAVRLEDGVVRADEHAHVRQARDGGELHGGVRERAALPEAAVRVLAALSRRRLDERQRLRTAADEQDDAAAIRDVRREVERQSQARNRLLEVEDVDAETTAEDVRLHVRVAHADLVAEVHARVEQVAEREQVGDAEVVGVLERVDHLSHLASCNGRGQITITNLNILLLLLLRQH